MKYLSFDIECCDGRHICEFGYVVADEKFNVLERDCITMNPEYKSMKKTFYLPTPKKFIIIVRLSIIITQKSKIF